MIQSSQQFAPNFDEQNAVNVNIIARDSIATVDIKIRILSRTQSELWSTGASVTVIGQIESV